jgi:hypothetical protein
MLQVTPITTVERDGYELDNNAQYNLSRDIYNIIYYNTEMYCNGNGREISSATIREHVDLSRLATPEGKLLKRLTKWVKEHYNYTLSTAESNKLGSAISWHNPGEFTYDIVDYCDWNAGDFGDSDSCFWGGRSQAKDIIFENGGLAIRFYDKEGEGCGRCWAMPTDEGWAVFNAYGSELEMVKTRLEILYPAARSRFVRLSNMGDTGGLLYINNGTALLLSERDVSHVTRIDLEAGGENVEICDECNGYIYDDDGTWIEGEDITVCQRCYDRYYSWCSCCDSNVRHSDMVGLNARYRAGGWTRGEVFVCESCAERYTECSECGYYIKDTDPIEYINDECVCGYCVKIEYHKCPTCKEYIKNGERCEECLDEEEGEAEQEVMVLHNLANRVLEAMPQIQRYNDPLTKEYVLERLSAAEPNQTYLLLSHYGAVYTVSRDQAEYYRGPSYANSYLILEPTECLTVAA